MADDCDRAARLQADLNRSAAARRQPESRLTPQGWCYSCGEELDGERLFCDATCADNQDRRERQRRMQ